MTNEEILKSAIEKAYPDIYDCTCRAETDYVMIADTATKGRSMSVATLIFSHDFAKAFWGEQHYSTNIDMSSKTTYEKVPLWKHHLQQIVLEEDPIQYLAKFL